MAAKKFAPFMGKESKKEEQKEKSMSKSAYKKGEKMEGVHGKKVGRGKKC